MVLGYNFENFANRVAGLNFNVIEYFANGMSGLWTRRVHLCLKSVLLKFCCIIEYFANGMSGLWTRRIHLLDVGSEKRFIKILLGIFVGW